MPPQRRISSFAFATGKRLPQRTVHKSIYTLRSHDIHAAQGREGRRDNAPLAVCER